MDDHPNNERRSNKKDKEINNETASDFSSLRNYYANINQKNEKLLNNLQKIEDNFRSTIGSLKKNLIDSGKTANFDHTFNQNNQNYNEHELNKNKGKYSGSFKRNDEKNYDNRINHDSLRRNERKIYDDEEKFSSSSIKKNRKENENYRNSNSYDNDDISSFTELNNRFQNEKNSNSYRGNRKNNLNNDSFYNQKDHEYDYNPNFNNPYIKQGRENYKY